MLWQQLGTPDYLEHILRSSRILLYASGHGLLKLNAIDEQVSLLHMAQTSGMLTDFLLIEI